MLSQMLISRRLLAMLCLSIATALSIVVADVNAAAGRFQFVYGEVTVTSTDGRERTAKRGTKVNEGDTISTTRRGTAQLRMVDGAALAVRPRSRVRIDAYKFDKKPESDRSFLSLLRGTLRSITGLVGRSNKSAYRVRTRTATIGIRGSDADIGFNPNTGVTAIRTYSGGHSLTAVGADGVQATIDTNPGQIAIAGPGMAPTFAKEFPFETPAPRATKPDAKQPDQQRRQQQRRARRRANAPPPASAATQAEVTGAAPTVTDGQPLQTPGGTALAGARIAPPGTAVAGAYTSAPPSAPPEAQAGTVVAGVNRAVLLDGANRPSGIFVNEPDDNFQFLRNNAPLVGPRQSFSIEDQDGALVSRGNWGAYGPGVFVSDNNGLQNAIGTFHFIVASNRTSVAQIQALGATSATYTFPASQLAFSNELGHFATTRSASADVNFNGNMTISVDAGGFAAGSNNWSLTGTDSVAKFIGEAAGGGQFSISNSSVAAGTAAGQFLGPQANGLIMSISAKRLPGGNESLNGTGVGFRGNPSCCAVEP
jgi:hypothetical protein